MHGKTDQIHHDGQTIYKNIPNPMTATRYHSLVIQPDTLSPEFVVNAWTTADDGTREIMGIGHKKHPTFGVQFHPESFLPISEQRCCKTLLKSECDDSNFRSFWLDFGNRNAIGVEIVQLQRAVGRVLQNDVVSDVDSPPHDKSVMDGYAVRSDDITTAEVRLKVVETIVAGSWPTKTISQGQSTRIMTVSAA